MPIPIVFIDTQANVHGIGSYHNREVLHNLIRLFKTTFIPPSAEQNHIYVFLIKKSIY